MEVLYNNNYDNDDVIVNMNIKNKGDCIDGKDGGGGFCERHCDDADKNILIVDKQTNQSNKCKKNNSLKLAEKEKMKADKLAEKEKMKADKLAEKEKMKVDKLAEKEKMKADKLAEKEKMKADKLAEKEKMKADKLAEKEKMNNLDTSSTQTEENMNGVKVKGRPRIEYNVKVVTEINDDVQQEYEFLEVEEYCIEVNIDGVQYYRDRNMVLYDFNTHEEL